MSEQQINQEQTVTFKLPKMNLQLVALILIVIIAAFQTFQILSLKGEAAIVPAGTAIQAPSSAPAGSGMVGGC